MARVEVNARRFDGQVVVRLTGELDVVDAARIAAALTALAGSGRQIIVDLAELEFIDSSGLAALVYARHQARNAGFDLLLATPTQQVRRMLAITRLIEIFTVHAHVDEAARNPRPGAAQLIKPDVA